MGYKAVLATASLFALSYPPGFHLTVAIACQSAPAGMIQAAQGLIPLPADFWTNVQSVAAGNFGARPASPLFGHVWDLEKRMAATMAAALADYAPSTYALSCPSGASTPGPATGTPVHP